MRPRVFPAEDVGRRRRAAEERLASMRPRVFPAEDSPSGHFGPADQKRCFNEAAGIPRGRRTTRSGYRQPDPASMRPRVFPAEDFFRRRLRASVTTASMRPRVFPAEDGFARGGQARLHLRASMRPRVFPAEDQHWSALRARETRASMRPRVFPAEDVRVKSKMPFEPVLQ